MHQYIFIFVHTRKSVPMNGNADFKNIHFHATYTSICKLVSIRTCIRFLVPCSTQLKHEGKERKQYKYIMYNVRNLCGTTDKIVLFLD